MRICYTAIFLCISIAMFSIASASGDMVINCVNQGFDRIGSFADQFRVSNDSDGIWNHKQFLGTDTGIQPESSINNYSDRLNLMFDHEGKLTTEAEISVYKIHNYSSGCCFLGSAVSSVTCFVIGYYILDSMNISGDEDAGYWGGIWLTGTLLSGVLSGILSYEYGKEIDRHKAIELVKEERRTGRKLPRPKPKFLTGVLIGLGTAFVIMQAYSLYSESG